MTLCARCRGCAFDSIFKRFCNGCTNGDSDPGCNYLQDHWCVRGLGAPVKEKWGSWRYNDSSVTSQGEQVGGWTVSYNVGGELRFITIKGAGHMAPQWRPLATT